MAAYLWGCSKGGVGKSTMAVNHAARLALAGRRVCLVDADAQAHATDWCLTRRQAAASLPKIDDRIMLGVIAQQLRAHAPDYDDLVIDAGGRDSKELRSAMRFADVIIMPFAASQFDLNEVETMHELLDGARAYNEGLRALAFINKAPTNWVLSRTAQAALEFIGGFSSMQCASTIVHYRSAFEGSITEGRAVAEIGRRGHQAAEEFANLMSEVEQLLTGEGHAAVSTQDDARGMGQPGSYGRFAGEA